MRSDDIRKLCQLATGETTPEADNLANDVVEKQAETSGLSNSDELIDRIDGVLGEVAAPVSENREGKVAIAMLLAAGDVLAQGD